MVDQEMLQAISQLMDSKLGVVRTEIDSKLDTMQTQMDKMQTQIDSGFSNVDSKFDAMQAQMDNKFSAVDNRFDTMQAQMDSRFSDVDSKFDAMQAQIDSKFNAMQEQMDNRFSDVDSRFDTMQADLSSLKKDVARINHTLEPKINLILEGIEGLQERNVKMDKMERTLADHDNRIFALEQIDSNPVKYKKKIIAQLSWALFLCNFRYFSIFVELYHCI